MRVIHVGMGKTASSSLQAHVFPRLSAFPAVGAYNPRELTMRLDGAVNGYVEEREVCDLAAEHDRLLFSNETLLEWDPLLWEASAERILRVFGPEAVILITLRDPESYLRSLYQQMLHAGKIRPAQEFFLPANAYSAVSRFVRPGELDAINIDTFDMVRMVELYVDRFASVVLVPFEAIGELRFLSEIWDLSEADRESLCRTFAASPRVNTSYTRLAMQLTLGRERLLARIGLKSRSASDDQFRKALAHARSDPLIRFKPLLPSWSKMMRLLSRYGRKAGYRLPDGLYLGRHMERNIAFYAAVRQVKKGYLRFDAGEAEGLGLATFGGSVASALLEGLTATEEAARNVR